MSDGRVFQSVYYHIEFEITTKWQQLNEMVICFSLAFWQERFHRFL